MGMKMANRLHFGTSMILRAFLFLGGIAAWSTPAFAEGLEARSTWPISSLLAVAP
jgi:hypothetical protein